MGLRVLLIQNDVKQRYVSWTYLLSLRVLLIQNDVKLRTNLMLQHLRLRVLLIQNDVKQTERVCKTYTVWESC